MVWGSILPSYKQTVRFFFLGLALRSCKSFDDVCNDSMFSQKANVHLLNRTIKMCMPSHIETCVQLENYDFNGALLAYRTILLMVSIQYYIIPCRFDQRR